MLTLRMELLDCHSHRPEALRAVIAVSPRQAIEGVTIDGTSRLAAGLHPWWLGDNNARDEALLERAAVLPTVVAIGETGLDTLRGPAMEAQLAALRRHIAVAEATGKPLIVHCVRASGPLIKLWHETAPHRVRALVHGFRGNVNVARALLEAGFYLSFGHRFNADALRFTPPERMLAETDDAPLPITDVINTMAATLGIDTTALTVRLQANLSTFLS